MELHNQEMDFQLNNQAKMIDELNNMVKKQRIIMKNNGVKLEEQDNLIVEDEKEMFDLLEEENENKE